MRRNWVTGFQVHIGARATWVGGIEPFGDEFARKEISPSVMKKKIHFLLRFPPAHISDISGLKSSNEDFARDVAAWTFQESLVLRIDNTTHHLVNEAAPKAQYTTNNRIIWQTAQKPYTTYAGTH
jgi:oligosaccharyltransferase complex subunit beta